MQILITGSRGFLGRFLSERLNELGNHVVGIHSQNCDLRQPASLTEFDGIKFDQIFHLAAWTQAGDFCLSHPGEQWMINQQINTNVLSWWQTKQPQAKMICMGTSCSYDPALPLEEDYYLQGTPIESLYTYAMTKRMLLVGLIALHKQFGLNYLYLIPSTLYGPSYHTDGRQMHFIFDLIRKILRGKLYGEEVILWGNGEQKRELVHVRDFVEIMLQLSQSQQNIILNVGGGQEYSIKQFGEMICNHAKYPKEKIRYDLNKYVGAYSKVLSIERIKKIFPDYKMSDLPQGIRETIDWFFEHRKQLLP